MRLVIITLMSLLLTACNCTPNYSVNAVVFIESNSEFSLAKDHRALKRLERKLTNDLIAQGINVYDDTVINLDDFNLDFNSYTRHDLINAVRNLNGIEIDYLYIISADAMIVDKGHRKQISTDVYATSIDVSSGRILFNVEESGRDINASNDCFNTCIAEHISTSMKDAASTLSHALYTKLPVDQCNEVKPQPSQVTSQYSLLFEGFSSAELSEIESYLSHFRGYKGLRYNQTGLTYSEIWYSANTSSAKLLRDVKKAFVEMDISVYTQMQGNEVSVKKISLRGKPHRDKEQPLKNINDW
ncbi:hypothetical protein CXF85_11135 [Colwellia sp. 75C3]|uniref:hypothetical protein n=1 Tax=Colwellia sp. 75C3 TaxID=888425 RepID=UPI000C32A08F|nr:hypothetical protein [Colwellia sp. 75C3]PKG83276.1 hypothetical protein CXF85_11135 [Colwellia sp. 75C3]